MDIQQTLARLGLTALTPMQRAAHRAWEAGRDFVLLSPTGTGKTLAYLLPLADALDADRPDVQAIVVTPTRELAQQTAEVYRSLACPAPALCLHGGRPTMDEHRRLRDVRPALVIATPGRLCDHLRKRNFTPGGVRTLVIDEFDKCLELGFRDELRELLSALPAVRRHVLLSATDAEEIPAFLPLGDGASAALRLDFLDTDSGDARLELRQVHSPAKDKLETLLRLLCTLGTTPSLVFANHRESVERIARYLRDRRYPCAAFHGGMEQDDRERALYRFRNGSATALVCTDLAARGLDIEGVGAVIHYHLPPQADAFTHRNGRTARWTAKGTAYLLLGPDEPLPAYAGGDIPAFPLPDAPLGVPRPDWATIYIGKGKRDRLSRGDVVGFLCKQGGLSATDLGRVDVLPRFALAAVRADRLRQVLRLVQGEKIKGLKTRIEEAR